MNLRKKLLEAVYLDRQVRHMRPRMYKLELLDLIGGLSQHWVVHNQFGMGYHISAEGAYTEWAKEAKDCIRRRHFSRT